MRIRMKRRKEKIPAIGSPLNYEGVKANASGKARFSGKIPQHGEDDFLRNHLWPDLAVR